MIHTDTHSKQTIFQELEEKYVSSPARQKVYFLLSMYKLILAYEEFLRKLTLRGKSE